MGRLSSKSLVAIISLALVISLLAILTQTSRVVADDLFEHYNIGDDQPINVWCYWLGQTFTASSNHWVTAVNLKICRFGSPGPVMISIYNAIGNKINGDALSSVTINGNELPTGPTYWDFDHWERIIFNTPVLVTPGSKYAIVVRVSSNDQNNGVIWRCSSTGIYPGGTCIQSFDGINWEPGVGVMMFEIWGATNPVVTNKLVNPVNPDITPANWSRGFLTFILLLAIVMIIAFIIWRLIKRPSGKEGYIYIMRSPANKKDYYKIGKSGNPEERAKQLSRPTGVAQEYEVLFKLRVNDAAMTESRVHKELQNYRVHDNREFFKGPIDTFIDVIKKNKS